MLIIKDLHGNVEALTDFQNVEVIEQVNGDFSISFTCFLTDKNAHSYPLVQEESIIELDGHEFRIKKMDDVRNRKSIFSAQHTFFDLIGSRQEEIFGGSHTLDDFMTFTLSGTGWTFENVDVDGLQLIPNFGNNNVVALVRAVCSAFNCEVKIMPGKHLKFCKEIGEDNDYQFRYRHNIKTLKRSVDTMKLATAIKGYGADGLEVEYRSPNEAVYGTIWAEPITDDRFTVAESLIERLKQELQDTPDVSIDLETLVLGFDAQLGDKVWLIYEPLNIEFQTRIVERKTYPYSKRSPIVTLSNKKQTLTDLLTETKIEIKENQKQVSSKIEQTNERITLAVSSIDGRLSETESRIEVAEGEISLKVSTDDYNGNTITSLITQDANSISLLANELKFQGLVTFTDLSTEGSTTIHGGNIESNTISADAFYGNLFTVGNGITSTELELYTTDSGAHYIKSTQAAGFRVESSGSLSLQAGVGYPIYANSQLQAFNGFYASGTSSFDNGLNVNGEMKASYLRTSYGYLDSDSSLDVRVLSGSYFGVTISGSQRMSVTYSQLLMQGTVKCTGVDTSSDINLKKDITDYTESALQKILDTPIVSYRLKEEDETARKTVGIIAQVAPDEIYAPGEDSCAVSLYPMVSFSWKGIQDVYNHFTNEIKQLKKEIDLLKGA